MKNIIARVYVALLLSLVVSSSAGADSIKLNLESLTIAEVVTSAERLLSKRHDAEAEEFLKAAIGQWDSPRLKILLADALLFQGDFCGAEALLKPIAHSENDSEDNAVTAQIKLGMLYENIGRLNEAEDYLRKAAENHEGASYFLTEFFRNRDIKYDRDAYKTSWWRDTEGQDDLQVRKIVPYFFKLVKSVALARFSCHELPHCWHRLRAIYKYKKIVTRGDIGRRGLEPGYSTLKAKL
jgi:tetratricopeptide (TPR) repeat protein